MFIAALLMLGIGFPVAFTFGAVAMIFGKNFFDFLDFTASNILLPISGIGGAIFVGYFMKKDALYVLFSPYMSDFVFNTWYFLLRYVAPVCVLIIMINELLKVFNG